MSGCMLKKDFITKKDQAKYSRQLEVTLTVRQIGELVRKDAAIVVEPSFFPLLLFFLFFQL